MKIGDLYVSSDKDGDVVLETKYGTETTWLDEDKAKELIQYLVEVFGKEVLADAKEK